MVFIGAPLEKIISHLVFSSCFFILILKGGIKQKKRRGGGDRMHPCEFLL